MTEPSVEDALKDPMADGEWLLAQIAMRVDSHPNPYLRLVMDVADRMGLVLPDGYAPHRWSWIANRKEIEPPTPNWNALVFRYVARRKLIKMFGFAIPTDPVLEAIIRLGKIVEMGAGCGYWASQLTRLGADVVAYDIQPEGDPNLSVTPWNRSWFDVQRGGVEKIAQHQDRVLFLGWPPFSPMAAEALALYEGTRIVHVGAHGLTGDHTFHEALERDWVLERTHGIPQWEVADDQVDIWRRR